MNPVRHCQFNGGISAYSPYCNSYLNCYPMSNGVNIDLYGLKTTFSQHLQELLHFKFQPFNPVFWIFFLVIFLITLRFWVLKKALSFCIAIAAILLIAAKVEKNVVDFFARAKENFDPFLLRIGTLVIISLIIIYYSFIKGEE